MRRWLATWLRYWFYRWWYPLELRAGKPLPQWEELLRRLPPE